MLLTGDQYSILRKEGTEYPFTSPLLNEHRKGVFNCAGCGQDVFSSQTKFESGTGWPSFWAPLNAGVVGTTRDISLGMIRTEVHCSRCRGHLGHLFDDGPKPTGLRYCMNGAAMAFRLSVS
ncbi:peptide-methionine (R)-S-oxide reductase [Rhizobium halophytocola]|uniref:peptide-methionine (R)-S-oxide reductase n=2 Tax=Rhizobium halophytocola TaxID=735519 RepID=A0ABS4E4B8_9HYPH|nr:peptide-methionine (R)-S-oxide reductase [Rhizobium halophytocola]